jgi:hypothetical protein
LNSTTTRLKTSSILLLIIAILVLMPAAMSCSESTPTAEPSKTTSSQGQFSVTISPSSKDVEAGESFTLDAVINTDIPSRGAQCALTFDATKINCTEVTEGNFYKDWAEDNSCSTIIVPAPVIDNENGKIASTGIAVLGTNKGGARGKGVLLTFHFNAIASGKINPVLSNIIVSDESGNNLREK